MTTVDFTMLSPIGNVLAHTLWQGVLIWALVALALRWTPKELSQRRYLIAATGLAIIPISCAFTLFYYLGKHQDPSPLKPLLLPVDGGGIGSGFIAYLTFYIGVAWAIGVVFFSVRLIQKYLQVHNLKHNGIHQPASEWNSHFEDLRKALRLPSKISFYESSLIACPTVIGCFAPMILFPLGMMSGLTTNEVRAILAHELAHLRRYDHYVNLVQEIIEVLFFYHPVTWWLSAQMRAEREYCCDQIAVELTGSPITLAKSLTYLESFRQLTALGLTAGGGSLSERIYRLLNISSNEQKKPKTQSMKTKKLTKTAGISALILLLIIALGYLDKATQKEITLPASVSEIPASDIPQPPEWTTQTTPSEAARSATSQIMLKTKFFEIDAQHLPLLKKATLSQSAPTTMVIYSEDELEKLTEKLHITKGVDILSMPSIMSQENNTSTIKVGSEQDQSPVDLGVSSSYYPTVSKDNESIDLKFFSQIIEPSKQNTSNYLCTTFQEECNIPVGHGGVIIGPVQTASQIVSDKVPLLGDIPFIGRMFRESSVIKSDKVIVMFILPEVLPKGYKAKQDQRVILDPQSGGSALLVPESVK